MLDQIKRALIGPPLATSQQAEKRLNKIRALAAFSPDALSSIAYANQEIYLGLLVAGAAGLSNALPIGIMITIVLAAVAFSYYQTIHGYPNGIAPRKSHPARLAPRRSLPSRFAFHRVFA